MQGNQVQNDDVVRVAQREVHVRYEGKVRAAGQRRIGHHQDILHRDELQHDCSQGLHFARLFW